MTNLRARPRKDMPITRYFLLDYYCGMINGFAGERIIDPKEKICQNDDVFSLLSYITRAIEKNSCQRKCKFRKGVISNV